MVTFGAGDESWSCYILNEARFEGMVNYKGLSLFSLPIFDPISCLTPAIQPALTPAAWASLSFVLPLVPTLFLNPAMMCYLMRTEGY